MMPDLRLVEADGAAVGESKRSRPTGPRRTKAQREAIKTAKLVEEAVARIDADLSRAIDAIAFLSRNELDPAPLIARISPTEAEAVSANLRKAVEWLNRFAEGWHVYIGNIEAENAPSGTGFEAAEVGASGSSAVVIDAVRKEHPETIKAASLELETAAMVRLLSQLAARRPKDHHGEPDMFADYPGIRQFIGVEVQRDGVLVPEWKPIDKVTLQEFGAWLSDDHRTELTRRQREPGMARLFRDLSEAAKSRKDITVGDAITLRRARGSK